MLSGITITLTGTDINGPVNKNTTTDGNGFYIFKDLMPGVYKITETQPAGVNDGLDTVRGALPEPFHDRPAVGDEELAVDFDRPLE